MPASDEFFDRRNPQAVLKHGMLARYAYYFAGRAGQATSRRVAFIDGYAGEGRYADGSPGSPLLLASEAERALLIRREVKLAFVEADRARRVRLQRSLGEAGVFADVVLDGRLEDHIDLLLERYRDHAVLLFLDPFGLGLDFETLVRILDRSGRRQPIDLLYHFSVLSVARMAPAALQQGPRSSNAVRLDAALGEVDWRGVFRAATPGSGAATTAALEVARQFRLKVIERSGVDSIAVPVSPRPGHLPKYLLGLFSKDPVGRATWDFADQAGNARVDWLLHCETEDFEANLAELEGQGILQLFASDRPTRERIEEAIATTAATHFARHLPDLLRARGAIRPIDVIDELYGSTLGTSRALHVRSALKHLIDVGDVDGDAAGSFQSRTFIWRGR